MNTYNTDIPLSALYESGETQPKTVLQNIPEYEPTTWVDETEPDIDAEHLNHIEQGIKGVTDFSNATAESVNQLQDRVDAMEGGGEVPEGILTTKDLVNDLDVEVTPGGKAIDAALLPQIKQAIESGGGASPSGGYVYVEPDESEEDPGTAPEPTLDADALGGHPSSYYAPQNQIADAFSEDVDYGIGDYCINFNTLYKFTDAKSAGPWDETKVVSCTIGEELSSLSGSITPIFIDQVVETQATLSDTGLRFTIPSNSIYCVFVTARYNAYPPRVISIKGIKDNVEDPDMLSSQNANDSGRISTSIGGYASTEMSFRVDAKYESAGRNRIQISGFYMKARVDS